MIRVVIADDHAVVRAGLRSLLGVEGDIAVLFEASDGRDAVDAVARLQPDVLLIDLSMPGWNGVEAIRRARAVSPATRVLVLSMHAAPDYVRPALRAGAHGYLVKGAGLDDLLRALRAVAAGERFFGPEAERVIALDAEHLAGDDRGEDLDRLTAREREVLQLVAEGLTNREIGAALGVSPKTVDAHRTKVMQKLDLHNAQALTRFAVRRGLISGE